MISSKVKLQIALASFLVLASIAASPASAQVRVFSLDLPAVITDPNGGFNINYTLGGAKVGVGAATARVNFYLSATANGSSGVALLRSFTVGLNGSGAGPYFPPSGVQTTFVHPVNLTPSQRTLLQNIANACTAQSLFLLADVDGGFFSAPDSTVMGTTKLPDYAFTGGTISSTVVAPGGSTNISFDLFTRCPTRTGSRVGIFLTDTAFNPLAFIGAVNISAGAGTFSLPPTPIVFSTAIPLGNYNILLIADVDGIIAESNENNNGGSFPLTIAPGLASASETARSLTRGVQLRDDVQIELEDLEIDPPADYVSKFGSGSVAEVHAMEPRGDGK